MFTRAISSFTRSGAMRSVPTAIAKSSKSYLRVATGLASPAQQTRSLSQSQLAIVSIDEARKQLKHYREMPNDLLLTLASLGDQDAKEERLIREIMSVDNVDWRAAQPAFLKIIASNRAGLFVATLPYKIGIFSAVFAGFASFPMIFEINTVMWFNELYVTTEVPEAKDLETPLEVGGWAWNWMEPPLGQISFFLLCMQVSGFFYL